MENNDIFERYTGFIMDKGHRPPSMYAFAKELGISESELYESFSSFHALENALFFSVFEQTLSVLTHDKAYKEYGARERVLALMYTWLEQLKAQRSLWKTLNQIYGSTFICDSAYLKDTRKEFVEFVRKIVRDGITTGEISDRILVPQWYKEGFWVQARTIYEYWLQDTSADFQKTDALVEKSVNFAFDVIQPNALDSGWDFVKFLVRGK